MNSITRQSLTRKAHDLLARASAHLTAYPADECARRYKTDVIVVLLARELRQGATEAEAWQAVSRFV